MQTFKIEASLLIKVGLPAGVARALIAVSQMAHQISQPRGALRLATISQLTIEPLKGAAQMGIGSLSFTPGSQCRRYLFSDILQYFNWLFLKAISSNSDENQFFA
jgi:hypothetical protein